MSENVLILVCAMPDAATAERIAELAIGRRFAACVNLQAPSRSIYRWEGKIERTEEMLAVFKTTVRRYPELEALICAEHPYELPEILAFEPQSGLEGYLRWVSIETQDDVPLPDGL